MKDKRKKGSALLVTVGFLAFIIVSTVAFAVYMRTDRMMSSGYNKQVQQRHLMQAALANAMEEIDFAIRHTGNTMPDSPHSYPLYSLAWQYGLSAKYKPWPGLGETGGEKFPYGSVDTWKYRVFSPYGFLDSTANTVPVMALEGLSYIPGALVNEVRAMARYTSTAQWHLFNYDAGRFAYVAVNVSDFLDANKLVQRFGRTSARFGHVNLVHSFEYNKGGESDKWSKFAGDAFNGFLGKLDTFVEQRGGHESSVPFVSTADFHTALCGSGSSIPSSTGMISPLHTYLSYGNSWYMYGTGNEGEHAMLKAYARRGLVNGVSWQPHPRTLSTSWNPGKNRILDLIDEKNQPWTKEFLEEEKAHSIMELGNKGRTGVVFNDLFSRKIRFDRNPFFYSNLFDYLDKDSIPSSLAAPAVERSPMIATVDMSAFRDNFYLKIDKKAESPVPIDEKSGIYEQTVTYALKIPEGKPLLVSGLAMFPYKNLDESLLKDAKYKVQACVKVFFGRSPEFGCRSRKFIAPKEADWAQSNTVKFQDGCFTFVTEEKNLKLPSGGRITKDNATWLIDTLAFKDNWAGQVSGALEEKYLMKITKAVNKSGVPIKRSGYPKVDSQFFAVGSGGEVSDGVLKVGDAELLKLQVDGDSLSEDVELTPYVCAWMRIIDSKNKTVDLSPASIADDVLNGINQNQTSFNGASIDTGDVAAEILGQGSGYPLLIIPGSSSIKFKRKLTEPGDDVTLGRESVFADRPYVFVSPDPRYNHCPEDMFLANSKYGKDEYLNFLYDNLLGKSGRDSDFFMFCSDQCRLQTMGELAFLPRLDGPKEEIGSDYFRSRRLLGKSFLSRSSLDDLNEGESHSGCFWRTYRLYPYDDEHDSDNLYSIDSAIIVEADKNGYRVNPYSDIDEIRYTVTDNTPHNYWASSTNKNTCVLADVEIGNGDSKDRLMHCFNNWRAHDQGRFTPDFLANITGTLFGNLRSKQIAAENASSDKWEKHYNDLGWHDPSGETLIGVKLDKRTSDIDEIDRKTLYSFWYDSLGNRQQLFLIFIRAEASSVVSDEAGEIPPQWSARGVALYWRSPHAPDVEGSDPNSSMKSYPNRSRLLFYHQFDY